MKRGLNNIIVKVYRSMFLFQAKPVPVARRRPSPAGKDVESDEESGKEDRKKSKVKGKSKVKLLL